MSDPKSFNPTDLAQFTGSEHWYRHGLVRSVLFTDGAKYVADTAGAYWLLDEIALAQRFQKAVAGAEFQIWKLAVKGSAATLTCEDDEQILYSKAIEYTDFPEDGVTFYFCNNVILLPGEY